jgi:chromosome partition protein MukF
VIRRLREQKLLVRVDGAGLLRTGEYALTRLATGIVRFFLEDEALTRESLGILASTLTHTLTGVRDAARTAHGDAAWRSEVESPLRVTLFELAGGIERRQRGFDMQQEELQREIAAVIQADWFAAVERCTALLDATSTTLRELNDMLLGQTQIFEELLAEVQERAAEAGHEDASLAARDALDQVERIAAWGAARQRAWSDYHEWVHRYLRDVVRLDPSRTLVHRLREQLAGRAGKAYSLTVAHAPPIQLLRAFEAAPSAKPVARPRKERDEALTEESAEDPDAALAGSVHEALAAGARGLAAVTARVSAADEGVDARFRTAGKVAQIVAQVAEIEVLAERPWVPAGEGIVVEEWPLGAPVGEREREEGGP